MNITQEQERAGQYTTKSRAIQAANRLTRQNGIKYKACRTAVTRGDVDYHCWTIYQDPNRILIGS